MEGQIITNHPCNQVELNIQLSGSTKGIRDVIVSSKALAVSDGSFQNQSGAIAWIINGYSTTDHIVGSMITSGTTGDHSSFQSKVASQYGLLLTLWSLLDECLVMVLSWGHVMDDWSWIA